MTEPTPSRRRLARTALWAVPTVAVATAAPAYAASLVACPTIPNSSTWGKTINGPVTNPNSTLNGTTVVEKTDSNGSSATTITYDIPVTVTGGVTYQIAFRLQTAPGYNGGCVTQNTSLGIVVSSTALSGSQNIGSYRTQTGGSGATVIAPPLNCDAANNKSGASDWGANGVKDQVYTTPTSTLPVPGTGTSVAHIVLTFTLDPTIYGNNDDWRVTPFFAGCTRT